MRAMQIITKRCILRDFIEADRRAFLEYRADPRLQEREGSEETAPGRHRQLLDRFMRWASAQPRRNYQFAVVERRPPGPLIGCCGLRGVNVEPGRAELGIELAPDHWGRYGYAIEVVSALVDYGFGELGLQEIYGRAVDVNDRVARLARWFGAAAVRRPSPAWVIAQGWSCVEWQLTRCQWERGRPISGSRRSVLCRPVGGKPEVNGGRLHE